MASGEVVGSIFLVEDELFRVEELMVGAMCILWILDIT